MTFQPHSTNDSNTDTNFLGSTTKYLQQFQDLQHQLSAQQEQFQANRASANELGNNLKLNQDKNVQNMQNMQNDDELKEIQSELNGMNIAVHRTGIDENTQGDLTIHRGNQESTHYKSAIYKDFKSMTNILRDELLDGCDKLNFLHPSKIQAEAIPRCLSNTSTLRYPNLIGQAHHGSGKTATFSLIMLQRVDENSVDFQGLVVVHSRELAIQTYNVCKSLGQFISSLKICLALKGEEIPTPWDCQIVIGTPGTIIDKFFNKQKRSMLGLKGFLKSFKILIVDEADEFLKANPHKNRNRMNGRGRGRGRGRKQKSSSFGSLFDQLTIITNELKQNCATDSFQTLLFSATYPTTVKKLALEIAPNPFIIKVAQKQVQLDNIRIFKIICDDETDKFNTLLRVISLSNIGQMIIFVNTVSRAKFLIDALEGKNIGISCSALYGRGMDIRLRDETMDQFRKNQTQCLVASNVIARGIDVPAVGLVVNFEIPINQAQSTQTGKTGLTFDSETFMHRVGRTGRFGAKGVCINLLAKDDQIGNNRLDAIQKEYSLNVTLLDNTTKGIKETISNWLGVNNI